MTRTLTSSYPVLILGISIGIMICQRIGLISGRLANVLLAVVVLILALLIGRAIFFWMLRD